MSESSSLSANLTSVRRLSQTLHPVYYVITLWKCVFFVRNPDSHKPCEYFKNLRFFIGVFVL
jgi:hypothetical protein